LWVRPEPTQCAIAPLYSRLSALPASWKRFPGKNALTYLASTPAMRKRLLLLSPDYNKGYCTGLLPKL